MEKTSKVYRQLNMNPDPSIFEKSLCTYAVSSAAAALDIPWEEAVRTLYGQAHELCLMPHSRKCIDGMMREFGFYLQPGNHRYYYPVSQLCADMPEKYGRDAVAVVLGDNEYFHYANRNPANNYIGDCVVRGAASALDISWHEALDELVRATDYKYPVINQNKVFSKLMEDRGYTHVAPAQKKGMRASMLCEEMNARCSDGERAFVDFRSAHAAAIVPVYDGDTVRYKVEDIWDSSNKLISEYWIGRPVFEE